jgi:hypothetical protein
MNILVMMYFGLQVDKNKLLQTEFPIIEFDPETFQVLLDYLHSGNSLETICSFDHAFLEILTTLRSKS